MNRDRNDFLDILFRYFIILLFGLGNLYIFYLILTPLTMRGVGFLLGFLFNVIVLVDGFMINGVVFSLVSACVGGSAFYLLFVLIMSCRDIKIINRVKIVFFAFIVLYVFNVLRIVLMVKIYGAFYFDLVHWIVWYFVSTLFVVVIWFLIVKLFEIKTIPVYSDFKFVFGAFEKKEGGRRRGGRIDKERI